MGKKSEAPPPPDMSGVTNASREASELQYKLGQEQLTWAREQFASNKGQTDKIIESMLSDSALARDMQERQLGLQDNALGLQKYALDIQNGQLGIQQGQLALQDKNQQHADDLYQRYEDVYQPAQGEFLKDAEGYDTAERRGQRSAEAQAAVGQQFEAARNNATRQLESYGINPASTRFAALDIGTRSQEAAAKVAAAHRAALDSEATGYALRERAIAMGKDLPGQGNAAANTALGAGNSAINAGSSATGAVNTALGATGQAVNAGNSATDAVRVAGGTSGAALNGVNSTFATGAGAMGSPGSYMAGGNSAVGQWGNTINAGYKNQLDQYKANQSSSSGLGTALGLGMTAAKAFMTGGTSLIGDAAGAITTGGSGGPMPFYAEGGAVDTGGATPGGAVPAGASPTGGRAVDDVPAQLTAGEFVMPLDVVKWKGTEYFHKEIEKARKASQQITAKPEMRAAVPAAPTFQSRPQQGAIPMGRAA